MLQLASSYSSKVIYPQSYGMMAANRLLERTLDDSANRLALPYASLATEDIQINLKAQPFDTSINAIEEDPETSSG